MPAAQSAVIANFDFGCPATTGTVAQWRVKPSQGGKLDLKFENPNGDNDAVVSVEVSADGSSWNATTAANNLAAVTNVSVVKRGSREATIAVRPGQDNHVRVRASGKTRLSLQIRGDDILEPKTI